MTNTPAFLLATLKVKGFKNLLNLPENVAATHCETHAIKAFISRVIRMHDGTKKRETQLQQTSLEKCVQLSEVIVLKWKSASNLGI